MRATYIYYRRDTSEMSWVTCQSPTSQETFVVNPRNVRRVVRKNSRISVLEFSDGTAIVIDMPLEEWVAQVDPPPQRVIQGVSEV